MRVALDISVLGRGVITPRNRTGIHRVVLDCLHALAGIPDVELLLCASSPGSLDASLLARDEHVAARSRPFPTTPAGRFAGRLCAWTARSGDHLAGFRHLHALARKATSLLERCAWLAAPPIPARVLRDVDVYLSPFDPLPPRRLMPGVRRAVIVHDLIPHLYPHLSGEGGTLRRILSSIGPDDTILTVSEATGRDVASLGFDPERIVATPLFADPAVFHPEADPAAPRLDAAGTGTPYLLALGNLEPRKNLSMALRAFEAVCAEGPFGNVRLVLAGTRAPGHSETIPERIADRVVFAGRVPDATLGSLYREAVAFLFPSLYEGFGLPVLEAMQCGVPVLASDRSSVPEVAGDAALLVSPEDPAAFADALRRILADGDLRRELSERGAARARTFSRERFAADLSRALGLPSAGRTPA